MDMNLTSTPETASSRKALLTFYQQQVETVLLPFWRKAVDSRHGGIFTCFDNSGRSLISRNKYTWSQGRFVWLWSRLSSLAADGLIHGDAADYLREAGRAVEFLTRHVFLQNGRCAYVLSESGEMVESQPGQGYDTSIYADCFVILGFSEYARVAGDRVVLDRAVAVYDNVLDRVQSDDFRTEPYPIPRGFRAHAITMILLRVAQCLGDAAQTLKHPRAEPIRRHVEDYVEQIFEVFTREDGVIHEMLASDESGADTLLARHFTPGHALECMWFVITAARERNRVDWAEKAVRTIRKAFHLGWDEQYGGLFRFVDRDGGEPRGTRIQDPFERMIGETWDTKIWWPHAEALYASLLAYDVTGDAVFRELYQRLHDYVFATFPNPDPAIGEWIQIRDRQGRPLEKVVALPVKDPYHILQSFLLIIELLNQEKKTLLPHVEVGNR